MPFFGEITRYGTESEVNRQMKFLKGMMEKLLKRLDRTARAVLAVALSAVMLVAVWAAVTQYSAKPTNGRPTLLFRCMDFKLVDDGSIQALVRISAENMPHFGGAAFNLEYNPYYIKPAYLEPDKGNPQKEHQVLVTSENSHEAKYFTKDEAVEKIKLSNGKLTDPFVPEGKASGSYGDGKGGLYSFTAGTVGATAGTSKSGTVSMYLKLNQLPEILNFYRPQRYGTDPNYTYDVVQLLDRYGYNYWQEYDPSTEEAFGKGKSWAYT